MSAANRVIALDGILDAATMRKRADGPRRYRYLPRTVVALAALAQGLAAVAEAIGEASGHARRARAVEPDEELRARLELAWVAGQNWGARRDVEWVDPQFGKAETVARLMRGAGS